MTNDQEDVACVDLDDGWPEDAAIMRHPNYNKEDIAFVRLTEKEEERKKERKERDEREQKKWRRIRNREERERDTHLNRTILILTIAVVASVRVVTMSTLLSRILVGNITFKNTVR